MTNNSLPSKAYLRIFDHQMGLYEQYARKHGLHQKSLLILMWIYYTPTGVTQNLISRKTFSSKQVIHATIKKFVQEGWLDFEAGSEDKRQKKMRLTPAGRQWAERILRPLEEAEEAALASLSKEEQALLIGLTQRYSDQLEENLLGEQDD